MRKIWIVRERLDWHNADPYDMTTAYSTKELAEAGLIERIEDVKKYFRENDYELFDDMTKIESDYGRMVTERDDWYCCWIEEIDNNNYYSVSDEATVTATTGTTTAAYISREESLRLKGYELMLHIVKSGCPIFVIPLENFGQPDAGYGLFIWSKDGEEMNIQQFHIGMDEGSWLLELWDKWVEMLPDLISEHRDTVGYTLANSVEEAWEKLYREMRGANNEAA